MLVFFKSQVAKEISAQIDAFRKLNDGELPVYVDGHQHVHILPSKYFKFNQGSEIVNV